jgi:hypothetical protein
MQYDAMAGSATRNNHQKLPGKATASAWAAQQPRMMQEAQHKCEQIHTTSACMLSCDENFSDTNCIQHVR